MNVHLITSDTPIRSGTELEALYGARVPKAEPVVTYEGDIRGADLSTLGNCSKCIKHPVTGRYVSGIVAGEEMRQAE